MLFFLQWYLLFVVENQDFTATKYTSLLNDLHDHYPDVTGKKKRFPSDCLCEIVYQEFPTNQHYKVHKLTIFDFFAEKLNNYGSRPTTQNSARSSMANRRTSKWNNMKGKLNGSSSKSPKKGRLSAEPQ